MPTSPQLDGAVAVTAPLIGTVVSVLVAEGDGVRAGQAVVILESMKMEHLVAAEVTGVVTALAAGPGDTVEVDQPLLWLTEGDIAHAAEDVADEVDLDRIRPDLADVLARQAKTLDPARPEAIAKHHAVGHRSARENVDDLCDPGTFVEYGSLMVAAQRRRRTVEDLIDRTPGDGMVAGIGHVNGDRFDPDRSRCVAMSYDYTVLAGTQGHYNHLKKDRMFELAERNRLPVVLFAEGGGGRPGDTDVPGVAGLDVMAFYLFGRLSGLVPLVGVVAGRCFAGNAVLLGCCDVIIATRDTNLGVGGPAMIEGGGLGVFRPEEVGPMEVQVPNGVVDIEVADEAEAVAVAKKYLSYFQGPGRRLGVRRPAVAAPRHPREPAADLRRAGRDRPHGRHRLGAGDPAGLRAGHGDGAGPDRGQPDRHRGQQPVPPGRRRRHHRRRQGGPRSCSCATPSTSPSCSSATRPGSWWGRRRRRRPPFATPPGCS